jgi:hypothetical protein
MNLLNLFFRHALAVILIQLNTTDGSSSGSTTAAAVTTGQLCWDAGFERQNAGTAYVCKLVRRRGGSSAESRKVGKSEGKSGPPTFTKNLVSNRDPSNICSEVRAKRPYTPQTATARSFSPSAEQTVAASVATKNETQPLRQGDSRHQSSPDANR